MWKIFLFIICLPGWTFSQTEKLHYQVAPTVDYFKALELAANGNIEKSKKFFFKYYKSVHLKKWPRFFDDYVFQMYLDLEKENVSEETAIFIFKSLHGTSENYSEEMFFLNRASALAPNYKIPYLLRGRHHLKEMEYTHALFEFAQLIERHPRDPMGYYFHGKTNKLLEAYENALTDLNYCLQLDKNFVEGYLEKFEVYYYLENYMSALREYQVALNMDSTAADGLFYSQKLNSIGIRYKEDNDYNNALKCFTIAIKADSRWIEPYLNRGITQRQLKNYKSAVKDFSRVIELKPLEMDGYFNRALTYVELDDYKNAEKDFIYASSFSLQTEKINFELGKMYYEQEKYDKAIRHFNNILEINDEDLWANYWLGISYDHIKSYKEAIIYYTVFLELVPDEFFKHKIHIQNRVNRLKKF